MTNVQPEPAIPKDHTVFSWKRIFKATGAIVLAGALIGGGYALAHYRPARILFASVVSGNREHFLACEELPFYPRVSRVMNERQGMVQKIKELGVFDVSAREVDCPIFDGNAYLKKGDIVVRYHSREQRRAVERLIGDSFFGIPWRGENR